MKQVLISYLLFAISFISLSQEEKENKIGIGFQVNTIEKIPSLGNGAILDERFYLGSIEKNKSYAFGLMATYLYKDNCSFRFKFGFTQRNLVEDQSHLNSNPDYVISHATITQTNIKLDPGIQLHLVKQKKSLLYCGFDLPFTSYGNIVINNHSDYYTSNSLSYLEDDKIQFLEACQLELVAFRVSQYLFPIIYQ